MSYPLEEIEGIGSAHAAQLRECGIATTDALLKQCAHAKGRADIAAESGVSEEMLFRWANLIDLMRVRGVGRQYAELLLGAGVASIQDLRLRKPRQLAAQMAQVNAVRKLTRRIPVPSMIEEWIELASKVAPTVT